MSDKLLNFSKAGTAILLTGAVVSGCGTVKSNDVELMYYVDRHGNYVTASGQPLDQQDTNQQKKANGHWEAPGESTWVPKSGRDAKGKIVHWNEEVKPERVWVDHPAGTNLTKAEDCELIAGRRVNNSTATRGGVELAKKSACTVQGTEFQEYSTTDRSLVEQASDLVHFGVEFEITNRKPDETNNILSGGNNSAGATGGSVGNITTSSEGGDSSSSSEVGDIKNVNNIKNENKQWQNQEQEAQAIAIAKAKAAAAAAAAAKAEKEKEHGNNGGGCKKKDQHGNDTCFFNVKTGELVTSINGERVSNRPAPRTWADVAKKSFIYG